MTFRKELENSMVREEKMPREPVYGPSYAGIEITTQEQRDAVNAAMLEQFKREMEAKEGERRITRTA
ncbi:hypothetical protein SD70_27745 [Gordoniibacillus kamchatkensis]|uniref:Uncharacterized protein n=2 Tax=Gordoniibacillus kamchatkensis TaxID=1590651 RepID=A0ABR5AC18_9BACL|nr:hypothetical protein SD70_27745 [Paenibacillus sp. VKM B-2647]